MKSFIHTLFAAALSLLFAVQAFAAEKVNINTADAAALDRVLIGVGPAKAAAIIEYRKANGPFKSAEELAMVKGIGLSTIEQNLVRTTPAPTGGRAPSGPTRTAWAIVARREILAKIFDKSFLVGTVLTVAVIAGFMVVSAFMEDRTKTYDLVASGADVSFARTLASEVTAVDDKVIVDVRSTDSAEAARALVLDDDADVWLHKVG